MTINHEIAEELFQLAIERGYPHCELLNKAANWINLSQLVEREQKARIAQIEAALRFEVENILNYDRGSTHYDGCEQEHKRCAALKRMRNALVPNAGLSSETKGEQG